MPLWFTQANTGKQIIVKYNAIFVCLTQSECSINVDNIVHLN
jgi:hypothetical protein